MAVTSTKYESESGLVHPIRLDSDYAADAGTPPSGSIDSGAPSVKVSKSGRSFGIRPRGWRLVRTIGTAPNQFRRYTFLPKLTPTAYDADPGSTIDIGGVSWTFLRRQPEDVN